MSFKTYLHELRNPEEIKLFKKAIPNFDKNDKLAWRGTVIEFMQKFGFEKIGSGQYAQVFIHPKYPYAIKVFETDTAYLKFVNWCFKNKNNPYVPKFRGKVVKIDDRFMAVRVEKMKEFPKTFHKQAIENIIMESFRSPDAFLEQLKEKKNMDWQPGVYDYRTGELAKGGGYIVWGTLLKDKNLVSLVEYLYENRKFLDIHKGNLMMRGKQVVLIDPFYITRGFGGELKMYGMNMSDLADLF